MKTFALGFLALTALSTAALADRTDIDPRDREPIFRPSTSVVESEGVIIDTRTMDAGRPLSAFERLQRQSEENENSGH